MAPVIVPPVLGSAAVIAEACPEVIPVLAVLATIALAWPPVIPVLAVFSATAALFVVTYPANAESLVVSTELISVTISAKEFLSAVEDARIALTLEVLEVIADVWPEVIPVLAVFATIALACPAVIVVGFPVRLL
jgi:hypothetical protein